MTEEESWGILTKEKFEFYLDKFTKLYGLPTHSRRISFSFWDHNRNEVDNRIRITDGKAEIMQKVGSWEMTRKWSRSELKINLLPDPNEIFNTYQMLRVLIPGVNSCYIYQYDNYVFIQPHFEIKLTHQFGKADKYNFEVEADTKKTDLNKTLKNLDLSEFVTLTTAPFWHKWNEEVNLKDTDLNEKEIRELIGKYL